MSDKIEVAFSANTEGIKQGSGQSVSLLQSTVESLKSILGGLFSHSQQVGEGLRSIGEGAEAGLGKAQKSVSGLGDSLASLANPITRSVELVGLLGAALGGAAFSKGISEFREITGEVARLSQRLGITTGAASDLRTALDDIGADGDTYIGAMTHLGRTLRTNEDALKEMGIKTRDASGNLRDANDIMQEGIAKVGTYRAGFDQTTAAMTIFGRSVEDVFKLQKLNNKVLDEAHEKNLALGLVITKENVEANKKYRMALNDVQDVMSALWKTIGEAVIPIFTDLMNLFAEYGPMAVKATDVAIKTVAATFRALGAVAEIVGDVIAGVFRHLLIGGRTFVMFMKEVIEGNYSKAWEVLKTGWVDAKDNVKRTWNSMVTDAEAAESKIASIFKPKDVAGAYKDSSRVGISGNKRMGAFKPEADKDDQFRRLEENLARMKLAWAETNAEQGKFLQFSAAQDASYWKQILDNQALTDRTRQQASAKYLAAVEADQKSEYQFRVASLRAAEEVFAQNARIRMQYAETEAAFVKAKYGEQSSEFQQAQARLTALKRQAAQQDRAIADAAAKTQFDAQLQALDREEALWKENASLYSVKKEDILRAEITFQERRFAIQLAAAQRAAGLVDPTLDPVKWQEAQDRIIALQEQFATKMNSLSIALRQSIREPLTNIFTGLASNINSTLLGLLNGTKTWAQATKQLLGSVGDTLIEELVTKKLAAMAAGWVKERAYAIAGIEAKAAEAGAGAAASAAETPFVGWAMALPAMAAVFAGVMALTGGLSAAGGYDIPSGVNPVVQTHAREMILPAKYADVIRGLADGEGAGAGGGDVHVHVHTPDAEATRRFLMNNKEALADAIRSAYRDGKRL